MKLLVRLLPWAALAAGAAHAQLPAGSVEAFLNADVMNECALDSDGGLWIASEGGALFFNAQTRSWVQYPRRQSGGPQGNDLATIHIDAQGRVWTGSSTRGVGYFDPVQERWFYFEQVPDPQVVRTIRTLGGGVYIGLQEGLSLSFQPNRTEICNALNPACIVPSFTTNDFALMGDTLWVATQDGLGRFNGFTWDDLDSLPAGSDQESLSLAVHQSRLYNLTPAGTYRLEGGAWSSVGPTGHRIRSTGGRLFRLDGTSLYQYNGSDWVALGLSSLPSRVTRLSDIAVTGDTIFIVTDYGLMLSIDSGATWEHLLPPGPPVARFHRAAQATPDGLIWFGNQDGLMSYDGTAWGFIPKNTQGLDREWIFALDALGSNLAVGHCCCNDPPRCRIDVLEPEGINNVAAYDAWALSHDNLGRLYGGTNNSGAYILEKAGQTYDVVRDLTNASTGGGLASQTVNAIAVLDNTVYFGSESGVSVWTHNGNVAFDTGAWEQLSIATGDLLDNSVGAITLSGVEDIWVGTNTGLHHFVSNAFGTGLFERFPTRLTGVLNDLPRQVNDIVVDNFNTVWCATDRGILYLKSGSREFEILTSDNSDIPDDNVFSAALHPDGSVWFGMSLGLARVDPLKLSGESPDSRYVIYPNPADPAQAGFVTLKLAIGRNQLADPSVDQNRAPEIFDTAGRKVGEFSFSSEWEWDGRNESGNLVAPGLYIVRGYSQAGDAFTVSLGIIR